MHFSTAVIRKHKDLLIAGFLLLLVFVLNFSWGRYIMGLDNISPYFGFGILLDRIKNDSSFFVNGPVLFSPELIIPLILGFPAWLISQIHYWLPFFVGVGSYIVLVRRIFASRNLKLPQYYKSLLTVLILGSLVSVWVFSEPIFGYINAFAGVPIFILFLTDTSIERQTKKYNWNRIMYYALGILWLFTSSLNLVAFGCFILSSVILSFIISTSKSQRLSVFWRAVSIVVVYAGAVQALIFLTGRQDFIFADMWNHFRVISIHPFTKIVTEDLRAAEQIANTITNTARFATGWMLLSDSHYVRVFAQADIYMTSVLLLLAGLAPWIVSIDAMRRDWHKHKSFVLPYVICAVASILIISYIGGAIIEFIPVLRDILRFSSIKLWPLLFIPYLVLGTYALTVFEPSKEQIKEAIISPTYEQSRYYAIMAIIIVSAFINGSPWFRGITAAHAKVSLPQEYISLQSVPAKQLLVLPQPQRLYFRDYSWGYYGSDFISYITKLRVIDSAKIDTDFSEYEQLTSTLVSCNTSIFPKDTFVLLDKSVSNTTGPDQTAINNCLDTQFKLYSQNQYFVLYQSR